MRFVDDLEAFLEALGIENGDIALDLAKYPFESDEHRDRVIGELTA